jgi:hypothetical protein
MRTNKRQQEGEIRRPPPAPRQANKPPMPNGYFYYFSAVFPASLVPVMDPLNTNITPPLLYIARPLNLRRFDETKRSDHD